MAEAVAAQYLLNREYAIADRNWRTRYCEIDIVAKRHRTVYFIEVKYRAKLDWGNGFDYITSSKQRQMQFAAYLWMTQHQWPGDFSLGAIELAGPNFEVTNYLTEL